MTRVLALVAFLASPLVASAQQQFDRRSREEPEIVVETGGRVGYCDTLTFTTDGKFLLAAGDDKVVRVWPHTADGLNTERDAARVLRWRAWRDERGGIKAMAVSPDGKKVALGGLGMKPSTVAVLDRATGETLALTWPQVRPGDPNFNAVTAVGFHPDGRVGFGTADGSLWVWDPAPKPPDDLGRTAALPARVGKHAPMKANKDGALAEFNVPRCVDFPDAKTLRSVGQSGQVLACDLDPKQPDTPKQPPPAKELFHVNAGFPDDPRVYRAAFIDGGAWLVVASAGPRVVLWSADGEKSIPLALNGGQFPRSIAWHPKQRLLAVGVGAVTPTGNKPAFFLEGDDEVLLYADPIKNPDVRPTKLKHKGRAESLAFHPTDPRLAVAGGPTDEVTLWDIDRPGKPLSPARGLGRRPRA
ncbi:MAG: WD40 repeat domain-containing protein, partial [Gemmataceae bacterium]|nr:WD40 repeat domain-containing protein [Gemmataceae bacterium]